MPNLTYITDSDMPFQRPSQPTWLALPSAFISILITTLLMKTTTSPNYKGLSIAAKAVAVFFIASIATVTVAKYFFTYDNEPEDDKDIELGIVDLKHEDFQDRVRVAAWHDEVSESTLTTSKDAKVGKSRLQKMEAEEVEKKAKAGAKKVRKMLMREFWPKKNSLLGTRKEEVVEVKGLEGQGWTGM